MLLMFGLLQSFLQSLHICTTFPPSSEITLVFLKCFVGVPVPIDRFDVLVKTERFRHAHYSDVVAKEALSIFIIWVLKYQNKTFSELQIWLRLINVNIFLNWDIYSWRFQLNIFSRRLCFQFQLFELHFCCYFYGYLPPASVYLVRCQHY